VLWRIRVRAKRPSREFSMTMLVLPSLPPVLVPRGCSNEQEDYPENAGIPLGRERYWARPAGLNGSGILPRRPWC
jgi:hypothetical protein